MRTKSVSEAGDDLAYLRSIKYRADQGRIYGRVSQYTFDSNFKPATVSKVSRDSLDYEEQFIAIRGLAETVVRLKSEQDGSERIMHAAQNGDFSFDNLLPGRYVFAADLPSVMTPYTPFEITVPAKGCYLVKVRTAYNGRLVGKVTDSKGTAISYADVEVERRESGARISLGKCK